MNASWKDISYKTDAGEKKTICLRVGYEVIERTIDKKRTDSSCSGYRGEYMVDEPWLDR